MREKRYHRDYRRKAERVLLDYVGKFVRLYRAGVFEAEGILVNRNAALAWVVVDAEANHHSFDAVNLLAVNYGQDLYVA